MFFRRQTLCAMGGAATLALGIAVAGSANAAELNGRLSYPRDTPAVALPETAVPGFNWEEPNGFLEVRPRTMNPQRELAVVLVGDLNEGERADSAFRIRGGDFETATMVTQQGSTLRIENTDPCAHHLFVEGNEEFLPSQTAPGNARTYVLSDTGSFRIQDADYNHVQGHVVVLNDLVARGTVDARGGFSFEDVPEGTYTMKVFFRGREVASQEIEIDDEREVTVPEALELDLSANDSN